VPGPFVMTSLGSNRQKSRRRRALGAVALISGLVALLAGCATVSVSGNQLRGFNNAPVRLHGVNRSGTEYACVQGWGIFDGPSDTTSISAIASWHANAVRVPLNEDCWLGINGVSPAYSGTTYQNAIVNYVQDLNKAGMSPFWTSTGMRRALSSPPGNRSWPTLITRQPSGPRWQRHSGRTLV
jgi:hypothetical protein